MWQEKAEPIFVVDDDQGILDSFDAMLSDDYPLVMINNAHQAMEMLDERQPRLLFLDIKMPGMNGLELLRWLKKRRKDVKVVIVTALPQDHYEEVAAQYGVYRYLKKPLDVDEIEAITRGALH